MTRPSLARHPVIGRFGYRLVARGVSAGLQACLLLLLARDLGPEGFGLIALGVTVGMVLTSVLGLGLSTRLLRLALESDRRDFAQAAVNFSFLAALVNGAIVYAVLWRTDGPTYTEAVICGAALVSAEHFTGVVQHHLAGEMRARASANVMVLQRLVPLSVLGLSTVLGASPAAGVAVGSAVVFGGTALWRLRPSSLRSYRLVVTNAWDYVAVSLSGAIANLDVAIVRAVTSVSAAGIYGAATRLASPLAMAVSTLLAVLVPEASSRQAGAVRNRLFRRATAVAAVMAAALAASSPIVAWGAGYLLGDGYKGVEPIVIAVTIGVSLSIVSQVIQAWMVTDGHALRSGLAVATGTVIGLAVFALALRTGGRSLLWLGPIAMQSSVLIALAVQRLRVGS